MLSARKNSTFAVTYRTTNVASFRGISWIDEFNYFGGKSPSEREGMRADIFI